MATSSRLSYADLAKKNITTRSSNDVQKAATLSTSTTATAPNTAFPLPSQSPSSTTTPSIQSTRPPSPTLDDASSDAKTVWDIRKEQFTSRHTAASRPQIPSTSQVPSNSSMPDDDDVFVVKMPLRTPPAVVVEDAEIWPAVGTAVTTPPPAPPAALANPVETTPKKGEKTKWVPIPPAELQAAADAARRSQNSSHSRHTSHSTSLSRQPRHIAPSSASGSQNQSRANSRVQSQTSSPKVPRGRRLPDESDTFVSTAQSSEYSSPQIPPQPLPTQNQAFDPSFMFPPRSMHPSPYYPQHAPMYMHGHHPNQTPPQHQPMPLPSPYPIYPPHPSQQYDYSQMHQPYMYWNGYGPSSSGSHTPDYPGYAAYPQPPMSFSPHRQTDYLPATKASEQPLYTDTTTTNGNSISPPGAIESSSVPAKPPRPQDSDAVAGPALERGSDGAEEKWRKVVFGSIGAPGSSQTPSPVPQNSTVVHDLEKSFTGFSIGVSDKDSVLATDSGLKWAFGTTSGGGGEEEEEKVAEASTFTVAPAETATSHPQSPNSHPPLPPLHIPGQLQTSAGFPANGTNDVEYYPQPYQPTLMQAPYPPQHHPTMSQSSTPSEFGGKPSNDPELAVQDFGFGFGLASGTGYALLINREEQDRREREREMEREREKEIIQPEMDELMMSASHQHERPSFFPTRGKRGGFSPQSNGYDRGGFERRGRGRGGFRGRGSRGGYGRGGYSPQQQHYVPHFLGVEGGGGGYGEVYYTGPMYPPPPFQVGGGGYYEYEGGYRPHPYSPHPPESPMQHSPLAPINGAPLSSPSQPPLPTPITTLTFPVDRTRYLVLGQVEYYLSPQNMAQDLFLRTNMDSEGWISISLLASFNRVKQLTGGVSIDIVRDAMSLSTVIEMHPSGGMARMHEWRQFVLPSVGVEVGTSSSKAGSETEPSPTTPADYALEHDASKDEDEDEEIEFVLGEEAGYMSVPRA